MTRPGQLLVWLCVLAWRCCPASPGEARAAAGAGASTAEPWSALRALDGGRSLPPLFRVLSAGRGRAPRLRPDSRALYYMKRLYETYATKEGIPKSHRSHLYNTVRLFTPSSLPKRAPADQVTGAPALDLLFSLDRVAAVERLLKSVLLYTLNSSGPAPSAAPRVCQLAIAEPRSARRTAPGARRSLTVRSPFQPGEGQRWLEVDVTSLLQPLAASDRSVHLSVNLTCPPGQPPPPGAQGGPSPLPLPLPAPPALILYLNDTSAQAHRRGAPLRANGGPSGGPGPDRAAAAHPAHPGRRGGPSGLHHREHREHRRRGREAAGSKLKKPLAPASFNLSEYFKQFLFPQNECELHDFRLSFSQLKWDDWIVAPRRYNPRYCKGDCPRAVGHRYGSPVHTVVQNIISEKLDPSVPRPSCVPARYSPLSVLTIEPDGSIAYKEYEDMIATKCTCR